jgi:hypothetical protein
MAIETLGEALNLGWRLHVRCDYGKRDAMKSIRECVYGSKAACGARDAGHEA